VQLRETWLVYLGLALEPAVDRDPFLRLGDRTTTWTAWLVRGGFFYSDQKESYHA